MSADDIKCPLSEQDIDDIILLGGYRNAVGGIYATSVYAFAKEVAIAAIQADRASRDERLREEIDQLRQDAARYRWLRERLGRVTETYDGDSGRIVEIGTEPEGDGWDVEPETLDAAIDQAMKEQV